MTFWATRVKQSHIDIRSEKFAPHRILLIKPSALGDIVHALPVLKLLRNRFRDAHIAWMVSPSFESLIKKHPALNETLLFDRNNLSNLAHGVDGVSRITGLVRELNSRQFDLTIDLQGLLRSGMVAWGTHAPVRIGFSYAREGAWLAYTHRVDTPHHERHAVERYLDIAEALGCGRGPVEFDFGLQQSDRDSVSTLLGDTNEFAVILPGTNWETKRWPAEHFATLSQQIRRELGLKIVIAGAKDAIPLAEKIPHDLNLAARTSLPQLVALLERASLVIANDSGPMHIAAALNRPLVTIYGPTNPIRTGPYNRLNTVVRLDIACSPCYSRKCSHTSCMNWLTPDLVFEQVKIALEQHAVAIR